jgi:sulfane dehydrogenase subunit SoxC
MYGINKDPRSSDQSDDKHNEIAMIKDDKTALTRRKTALTRRRFIQTGFALSAGTAGSLAFNNAQAQFDSQGNLLVAPWTKKTGSDFLTPPYGVPSKYEKGVVRILPTPAAAFPTASRTPLQNLYGIITPNGLIFERHHAGVPDIDPDAHRLVIHGLVDRPLMLTMNDLVRFPSVSMIYFLECSGNGSAELKKRTGTTVQETHGLLSCCEWTGVRLSTVLAETGVKSSAKWLLAEGSDGAAMTRSIPMQKAMDDALLVYAQNGEMLRPEQGYPLRLFLPGYEGNTNIKWLRRLKLGTEPWQTREETSTYTDLGAGGKALQFTFEMGVKSVITQPSGGMRLKQAGFYEITGFAWTGAGKIRSVDVSIDGGKSWDQAALQEPVLNKSLTRFRYPWMWKGEPTVLLSRASDSSGAIQPTLDEVLKLRSANSVYHNNAIQPWLVTANGEVSNGR